MIKVSTPLLGYISWSSFQWIIFINAQSVKNQSFTMLRMINKWLQWQQNIQKPLDGLFLHLVWPKNELESLSGSFSQLFVVSAHQNTPKMTEPSLYVFPVKTTQHAHASCKKWHFVTLLGSQHLIQQRCQSHGCQMAMS
jgi:hypothetical protein